MLTLQSITQISSTHTYLSEAAIEPASHSLHPRRSLQANNLVQVMEAPLHQLPPMQHVLQLTHPNCKQQHVDAAAATDMSSCFQLQQLAPPASAGGAGAAREQCPRCASHDTKFCYYNNYNTSQPRHFCRACRRYWTLGGSLRNVPIGGSTRKRLRPAPQMQAGLRRPPLHFGGAPPPQMPPQSSAQPQQQGLLGSLFALGGAPLLEGRVGFDLGLGLPGLGLAGGAGEMGLHSLGLRGGGPAGSTSAAPLIWPAGLLENGNVDTWKVPGGGAGAMWAPEFSSAATVAAQVGGLFHGGGQML